MDTIYLIKMMHNSKQKQQGLKLTLPLELADDGVQEGVLVRHMTSPHGHGAGSGSVPTGPEWTAAASRLKTSTTAPLWLL